MKKLLMLLVAVVAVSTAGMMWVYRPISASHPALKSAELPPLIPLREFYANADARWRYQLSPDGKYLSWLEAKWLKPALWVKPLEGGDGTTFGTQDVVRRYGWSSDSRYLIYQADRDGWENDVIVSIDTQSTNPTPRSYDFGARVKSFVVHVPDTPSEEIIIGHNGQDLSRFDLYRLNLKSGETTAINQSQEFGIYWHLSKDGEIIARTRRHDGDKWTFEILNGKTWQPMINGGFEDAFYPISGWEDDNEFYAISNLGRDKRAVVKFDLETKTEKVIHSDLDVDVHSVLMNRITEQPRAIRSYPGHQKLDIVDPRFEKLLSKVDLPENSSMNFHTISQDGSKVLLSVETAEAGFETRLVDGETGEVSVVSTPAIARFAEHLSSIEPVNITARDGLKIPAYLARPKGVTQPVPLVILIHGGPVHRSYGGWNTFRQLLTNRGYAVLDVNYRGSDGYGRSFREAAYRAVSRQMDDDITDARAWAVEQGIADPDKVAVVGGSFGGLKVLTAMTRNPELYAAGININGVSDLVSFRSEIPPYWQGFDFWYEKYVGDVNSPTDRDDIAERSPINNADNLAAPLMIIQSANDVRVRQSQSDRMVEALEKAGKDVEYILLQNAGHQFSNWGWKTNLRVRRKMMRFLAEHLGGRADGFDYAVLGADVLPSWIGQ